MDRPAGVTAVAVALAVLNGVTSVVVFASGAETVTKVLAIFSAVVGWAVLYYFWQRRNWARILILTYSGFLVLNALMASRVSHSVYLYMIGLAAVGVFLLFYLNRPEIRVWFNNQTEAARRSGEDQKPGIGRSK